MENVLENTMESTVKETERTDEEKIEYFMRGLVTVGFEYAELETQEEKDELVKNEGASFYRFVEEKLAHEEFDEDDKHDGRVMIEEMIHMAGRIISRASEKGRNELKQHCFTEDD